MAKIDLHLHSKYSEMPSQWFMKKLSALECYTEIEDVYKIATSRGMDFITITDHNRIDGVLKLKEKYPEKVLVGVESSVKFPESGHYIDLLLYGITPEQFEEIELLRDNVYEMRDYLKNENIAYSVAHPTFSENGKLDFEHLEKLILLFDVFEARNGGRIKIHNDIWIDAMLNLTPEIIEDLYVKYRIEPISDTPWIKGFTAGSDDHSGLFIGTTYTFIPNAKTVEDVINSIKEKNTIPFGDHNNFKRLLFTVLQVFYQFLKDKNQIRYKKFLDSILIDNLIYRKKSRFQISLYIGLLKMISKFIQDPNKKFIINLIDKVHLNPVKDVNEKLDIVFEELSLFLDERVKKIFSPIIENPSNQINLELITQSYNNLPGLLLSFPFLYTFKHLNKSKHLIDQLENKFCNTSKNNKKILWFTDTLNDINGVSTTLKELGWQSYLNKKDFHLVVSIDERKMNGDFPPNIINLPFVGKFNLPYYERYELSIPSILRSLNILSNYNPDVIYVSTPGPIGLLGLLMAKLYGIKCVAIYHTDFKLQVEAILKDYELAALVDRFVNWFYSQFDVVESPSEFYVNVLKERKIKSEISVFRRSINLSRFSPKLNHKEETKTKFKIKDGINLLYSGRISRDKNLDFLIELFYRAQNQINDLNLILVGDGPYLDELKSKNKNDRILFTGGLNYEELPQIYSVADIFLFPSETDTFGMVVLEAQACGIPAIVSDYGGPQEIIINSQTGFVAQRNNINDWLEKLFILIEMKQNNPELFNFMKVEARKNAVKNFNWKDAAEHLFKKSEPVTKIKPQKAEVMINSI